MTYILAFWAVYNTHSLCTYPSVSAALSIFGSVVTHTTEALLEALKKVIRCLRGTIDPRLTLGGCG
jgi:hypothetical protein